MDESAPHQFAQTPRSSGHVRAICWRKQGRIGHDQNETLADMAGRDQPGLLDPAVTWSAWQRSEFTGSFHRKRRSRTFPPLAQRKAPMRKDRPQQHRISRAARIAKGEAALVGKQGVGKQQQVSPAPHPAVERDVLGRFQRTRLGNHEIAKALRMQQRVERDEAVPLLQHRLRPVRLGGRIELCGYAVSLAPQDRQAGEETKRRCRRGACASGQRQCASKNAEDRAVADQLSEDAGGA